MPAGGSEAREVDPVVGLATALEHEAPRGAALQRVDVGECRFGGRIEGASRDRQGFAEVRIDAGAQPLQRYSRHELERERAIPERGAADPPGKLTSAQRTVGERERAPSVPYR